MLYNMVLGAINLFQLAPQHNRLDATNPGSERLETSQPGPVMASSQRNVGGLSSLVKRVSPAEGGSLDML